MSFYSTLDFGKSGKPVVTASMSLDDHTDVIPDMRKSRYGEWSQDYAYNVVKHKPVPFIYNDTGVLWEEKMGLDFTSPKWYEDFEDIRDRIYSNITRFVLPFRLTDRDINSELHNAKKNLPLALSLGALIVVVIYMAYFVGLTGSMSTAEMMAAGDMLPEKAFGNLFGPAAGTIVLVFIVISCLGTTNGLMMGCARGAYSLGVRGEGIAPRFFARVDKKTDMATNSAWFGIIIALLWYSYWHFFFIHGMGPSFFNWEPDELPIITLYAGYFPMCISVLVLCNGSKALMRYILPVVAIV